MISIAWIYGVKEFQIHIPSLPVSQPLLLRMLIAVIMQVFRTIQPCYCHFCSYYLNFEELDKTISRFCQRYMLCFYWTNAFYDNALIYKDTSKNLENNMLSGTVWAILRNNKNLTMRLILVNNIDIGIEKQYSVTIVISNFNNVFSW